MGEQTGVEGVLQYSVLLTGIEPDVNHFECKARLVKVFKASPAAVEAIFSALPYTVKSGIDIKTAEKYKKVFAELGALSRIEQEDLEIDLPLMASSGSSFPNTKSSSDLEPVAVAARANDQDTDGALNRRMERLQSSSEVKRQFVLSYLEEVLSAPPLRTTYEDLQTFRTEMSEVAFWGRCIFYPDDPSIRQHLASKDIEVLEVASGRITDSTIRRFLEHLKSPNQHETIEILNLLVVRFSLFEDSQLMAVITAFVESGTSRGVLPQIRMLREGSASTAEREEPKVEESRQSPATVEQREGPLLKNLPSVGRVLVLAAGAGAAAGLLHIQIPWLAVLVMLATVLCTFLLWCLAEHESGRLNVFWCPADATLTVIGSLLAMCLGLIGSFWQTFQMYIFAAAGLVLLWALRQVFVISARTNWTMRGVIVSILAKVSIGLLSIMSIALWLVHAMGKPDRRSDQTEWEHDRDIRNHERAVAMHGLVTVGAIAGAGWLFTRNRSDNVVVPFAGPAKTEELAAGSAALVVLIFGMLVYHQEVEGAWHRLAMTFGTHQAAAQVPSPPHKTPDVRPAAAVTDSMTAGRPHLFVDVASSLDERDQTQIYGLLQQHANMRFVSASEGFELEACDAVQLSVYLLDMNRDSVPEVGVRGGSTCTSGMAGSTQWLFIKGGGQWKLNFGVPGGSLRFVGDSPYRDALIDVPGKCQPLWRWNGTSYVHVESLDSSGVPCAKDEVTGVSDSAQAHQAISQQPIAQTDQGPSFECRESLSRTEKIICENPDLARIDRDLADVFASARQRASDGEEFMRLARASLKEREQTCVDRECLMRWYDKRRAELAGQPPLDSGAVTAAVTAPTGVSTTAAAKQPSSTSKLIGNWRCEYGDLVVSPQGTALKFDTRTARTAGLDYIKLQVTADGRVRGAYSDNSGWTGTWTDTVITPEKGNAYRPTWESSSKFYGVDPESKGFPVREGKVFGMSLMCAPI